MLMPIGPCRSNRGQTISQPVIVAMMSQALHLVGDETVLEIGTGSGYQTAILAELAARVISHRNACRAVSVAPDACWPSWDTKM